MTSNLAEHDLNEGEASGAAPAARPRTRPFFFGSAAQPLFGLYGPPQSDHDRDHGVLLCPPVGHEYLRANWGLRLLGDQLIQAGFHVLRFDYSCLGDSWGAFEQATVGQWLADIETALGELQDNAGVRHISVIGLRLGATLAYAAVTQVPVHRLVLWDPVVLGCAHVEELRAMQVRLRTTWPYAPLPSPGAAQEELLGYRYTAALIQQMSLLDLDQAPLPQADRVTLVASADNPPCRRLHVRLRNRHVAGELRVVPDTAAWDAVLDDLYVEPLLMPNMRRALVDLLGEPA